MKVLFDVPVPPGFEYTGECRQAHPGEYYMVTPPDIRKWKSDGATPGAFPIFRKVRWRADKGIPYWSICSNGQINRSADDRWGLDNTRYTYGNYFRSEKVALAAKEKVAECLKLFHGVNE